MWIVWSGLEAQTDTQTISWSIQTRNGPDTKPTAQGAGNPGSEGRMPHGGQSNARGPHLSPREPTCTLTAPHRTRLSALPRASPPVHNQALPESHGPGPSPATMPCPTSPPAVAAQNQPITMDPRCEPPPGVDTCCLPGFGPQHSHLDSPP